MILRLLSSLLASAALSGWETARLAVGWGSDPPVVDMPRAHGPLALGEWVDLYTPAAPAARNHGSAASPLVVFVHGGAWRGGTHHDTWHGVGAHGWLGKVMASGPQGVRTAVVSHPKGRFVRQEIFYVFWWIVLSSLTLSLLPELRTKIAETVFPAENVQENVDSVTLRRWLWIWVVCYAVLVVLCFVAGGKVVSSAISPTVSVADQVASLEDSLRTLLAHTNATRIVLAGHSSGGHLAAMVALRGHFPQIKTFVGVSGVYDPAGLLAQPWPISSVFRHVHLAPVFHNESQLEEYSPLLNIRLHTLHMGTLKLINEIREELSKRLAWWDTKDGDQTVLRTVSSGLAPALEAQVPPPPPKNNGTKTRAELTRPNRIVLMTGRHDYYVLLKQADTFMSAITPEYWLDVKRVYNVGAGGHGMGLIRSRDFVARLRAEAARLEK
jgi:acetyl esterase/lipase